MITTMGWFAINNDGTRIEEGQGFEINRKELKSFGISVEEEKGNELGSFVYDTSNGEFNLGPELDFGFCLTEFKHSQQKTNVQTTEITTTEEANNYELTKNNKANYEDCIAYQNFYFDINDPRCSEPKLRGYNFGYKTQIEFEDCKINFQPLLVVNINEKLMFKFKLLCDRDLDCKLTILLNGQAYKNIEVNLIKNISSKDIDIVL